MGAAAGAGAACLYPGAALRADRGSSARPFELTSFRFSEPDASRRRNEAVEAALRMLVATGGPAGESSEASGSKDACRAGFNKTRPLPDRFVSVFEALLRFEAPLAR